MPLGLRIFRIKPKVRAISDILDANFVRWFFRFCYTFARLGRLPASSVSLYRILGYRWQDTCISRSAGCTSMNMWLDSLQRSPPSGTVLSGSLWVNRPKGHSRASIASVVLLYEVYGCGEPDVCLSHGQTCTQRITSQYRRGNGLLRAYAPTSHLPCGIVLTFPYVCIYIITRQPLRMLKQSVYNITLLCNCISFFSHLFQEDLHPSPVHNTTISVVL